MGRKRKKKRRAVTKKRTASRTKRSYSKRGSRDHNSPVYVNWRDAVKTRDEHCCQWPSCGSRHRIQVHHIKTWARFPSLRYVVANGITLCERCHEAIKGKECDFETFFLKLLETKMIAKIKKLKEDR